MYQEYVDRIRKGMATEGLQYVRYLLSYPKCPVTQEVLQVAHEVLKDSPIAFKYTPETHPRLFFYEGQKVCLDDLE